MTDTLVGVDVLFHADDVAVCSCASPHGGVQVELLIDDVVGWRACPSDTSAPDWARDALVVGVALAARRQHGWDVYAVEETPESAPRVAVAHPHTAAVVWQLQGRPWPLWGRWHLGTRLAALTRLPETPNGATLAADKASIADHGARLRRELVMEAVLARGLDLDADDVITVVDEVCAAPVGDTISLVEDAVSRYVSPTPAGVARDDGG